MWINIQMRFWNEQGQKYPLAVSVAMCKAWTINAHFHGSMIHVKIDYMVVPSKRAGQYSNLELTTSGICWLQIVPHHQPNPR